MSSKDTIPNEIPSQIKNYDDIILYALGSFGPLERENFINDPQKSIKNRMNKNTFHKWAKELKKNKFIEVEPEGKKRIYKITLLGENELLRRIKQYHLDFETINKIEQKRLRNYIASITKFFNKYNINDDEIKVEFLELANEITIDKINIYSEEQFNKLILFLVLNHPKFYLTYNISIIEFLEEFNKNSEDLLTETDINMFLQKVINENIYSVDFYTLKIYSGNRDLYFRANSEYGIIFGTVVRKRLRKINYLKSFKELDINIKDLLTEIIDLLVYKFKLFDKNLEDSLYKLLEQYIEHFKEDIIKKTSYSIEEYRDFFSILGLPPISKIINLETLTPEKVTDEKFKMVKPRDIYEMFHSDFRDFSDKSKFMTLFENRDKFSKEIDELWKLYKDHDYKALIGKLDNIIKQIQSVKLIYFKINILVVISKYSEALEILESYQNLGDIPKDFMYYYFKAYCYRGANMLEEALKSINKAIDLNSGDPDLFSQKARILNLMKNYDSSLKSIEFGLKINPKSIWLNHLKLVTLKSMKRYDECLGISDKLIEFDPNNYIRYLDKSLILKRLGKSDEAIVAIDKAIELNPKEKIIYLEKADILSDLKTEEELLLAYDKYIEKFPNYVPYYEEKIDILIKKQRYDEALEVFDLISNITKRELDPPLIDKGIDIFYKLKDYEKALDVVEKAIEDYPNLPYFLKKKLEIVFLIDGVDGLINVIEGLSNIEHKTLNFYNLGIESLIDLEHFDDALFLTDNVINKFPEPPKEFPWATLVKALDVEDPDERQSIIEEKFPTKKDIEQAFYANLYLQIQIQKPSILFNLGKYEEAIKEIDNIIENNKNFPMIDDLLILRLIEARGHDKALDLIDKLDSEKRKIHYKNILKSRILNSQAYKLARENKKEESIEIIIQAITLNPNEGDLYDSYGEILMIFGDYKRAIEKFDKAVELTPLGFFTHETYIKRGNCYKELGEYKIAMENLKKGEKLAKMRNSDKWVEKAQDLILAIYKKLD